MEYKDILIWDYQGSQLIKRMTYDEYKSDRSLPVPAGTLLRHKGCLGIVLRERVFLDTDVASSSVVVKLIYSHVRTKLQVPMRGKDASPFEVWNIAYCTKLTGDDASAAKEDPETFVESLLELESKQGKKDPTILPIKIIDKKNAISTTRRLRRPMPKR